jgi:acetyl-CoA synthetase
VVPQHVGGGRCPIVDTFWQTETGGHMITPLPGATPLVPGSCTLPFPGIMAAIVDETGNRRARTARAASWSSRSPGRR